MAERVIIKVLENIPKDQPVTLHTLTCLSGLDHRTVNRCLDLIMQIQGNDKVVKEYVGMRLFVKKGHTGSGAEPLASH